MNLTLSGHNDRYAVEQLLLSLFPANTPLEAESRLHRGTVWLTATAKITLNGQTHAASRRLRAERETVRLRRRALQQSVYLAALPLLDSTPPWGALAGVRPTKITTRHLLEGGSPRSADKLLKEVYYVTPQRRKLAVECSQATVAAAGLLEPEDLSVYVGIPFCPSRCSYCSFVSRSIGHQTELIEPYLQALLEEIAVTGELLAHSGRQVRTIYIGGGTPTTLSAEQLERLMTALTAHFDRSRCLEFTVEAGRPDTLSPEKLAVLRRLGADRVSINPQTMEDAVLCACARPHTGEDVRRAYAWAQNAGFENINTDLIAGLPSDSPEGFARSLEAVAALKPANITVHTLALKKGADLFEKRGGLPGVEQVARMLALAGKRLPELGYRPYYLYRQKYMSGSFENVGWTLPGRACLYNIYMMEELHSIVSLGGGGVSKLNLPDGTVRRFANPKFPEQYLQMLPKVLEEKKIMLAQMG